MSYDYRRSDRTSRRQERQRRLQELRSRTTELTQSQPNLWDKSRNYVAMGVRGATGVGSSMGGPMGAAIAGAGEVGAQTIEKRDKYNFPQVSLQAGIGAVPGSALFKAGSKVANLGRGALLDLLRRLLLSNLIKVHISPRERILQGLDLEQD